MKLWLDDVRPAPSGWQLATTASEAIWWLATGAVTEVSLDHDLGDGTHNGPFPGTGYDVACWIEKQAHVGRLKRLIWAIHSANPDGAKRMEQALRNAERYWREREDKP